MTNNTSKNIILTITTLGLCLIIIGSTYIYKAHQQQMHEHMAQISYATSADLIATIEHLPHNAPNYMYEAVVQSIKKSGKTLGWYIQQIAQKSIDAALNNLKLVAHISHHAYEQMCSYIHMLNNRTLKKVDIHADRTVSMPSYQQAKTCWNTVHSIPTVISPLSHSSEKIWLKSDHRNIPYQLQGIATINKYNKNKQVCLDHTIYIPNKESSPSVIRHVLLHELTHARFADHAIYQQYAPIYESNPHTKNAWNQVICALEQRADLVPVAYGSLEDAHHHQQAREEIYNFVKKHNLKNRGTHPTSQERWQWAVKLYRLKEMENNVIAA